MTVRYTGKCRTCKNHSVREYSEFRAVTLGKGMYRRPGKEFGRFIGETWIAASADAWCPRCNAYAWNGKRIEGTTTDHVCDVRCTDAKGFKCECACGGAMHGQGLLVCEPA